jgi:hypothetical protein
VLCLCIKKLEENIVLIQHKVTQKQGEKNKYKGLEARPPSKIRKQKKTETATAAAGNLRHRSSAIRSAQTIS